MTDQEEIKVLKKENELLREIIRLKDCSPQPVYRFPYSPYVGDPDYGQTGTGQHPDLGVFATFAQVKG